MPQFPHPQTVQYNKLTIALKWHKAELFPGSPHPQHPSLRLGFKLWGNGFPLCSRSHGNMERALCHVLVNPALGMPAASSHSISSCSALSMHVTNCSALGRPAVQSHACCTAFCFGVCTSKGRKAFGVDVLRRCNRRKLVGMKAGRFEKDCA